MSLVNPMSEMQKYDPFDGGSKIFWGTVVDNVDPEKRSRIKVKIPELLPFEKAEHLPWMYALQPVMHGQGGVVSPQYVPEIGTLIGCIFPHKSIYMGYYAWQSIDKNSVHPDFQDNYPNKYGWHDSVGNKFIVNKDPSVNTVEHFYGDGGHVLYDNKNQETTYTDPNGHVLHMERSKNKLTFSYGGVIITIDNGRLGIVADTMDLQATDGGITALAIRADIEQIGNFDQVGNLSIQGNVDASGTVIDGAGNTNHHSH